jgi:hypothetical protein
VPNDQPADQEKNGDPPLAAELPEAVEHLVRAIRDLRLDELPRAEMLRSSWHDLGAAWTLDWARAFGRDLRLASASLAEAEALGLADEGEAEIENALWRLDSAFEKFHDLSALTLGVPATRSEQGPQRGSADSSQTGGATERGSGKSMRRRRESSLYSMSRSRTTAASNSDIRRHTASPRSALGVRSSGSRSPRSTIAAG